MKALITGVGWITASGMGKGRKGKTFAMPEGQIPRLTRKDVLGNKAYRRFGRMDPYSKLGMGALACTLRDARLPDTNGKHHIGIIAGTIYGCLKTDLDYYNTVIPQNGLLASPNLFTYTLPNCFLGETAICFGLTGPTFIITEAAPLGLGPIKSSLDHLQLEACDIMLAGMCELGSASKLQAVWKSAPGAVFFAIERSPRSRIRPYGELTMNKKGDVFFNGSPIRNLIDCVNKCLDSAY